MSLEIPQKFITRLADMGGRLPDGTPKLRLVFGPDAKRPHGQLAGRPKYIDPTTGKPMAFWILEMWIAPEMCGDRDTWNYEFLGPYPADCNLECCNRGYWGIKTPITTNGELLPITESVIQSIERKQFMDIQFSMLNEIERLEFLNAQLSRAEQIKDAEAVEEMHKNLDLYAKYKEKWDNDDNRVFSWADKYAINVPGSKMPIGGPKLKQ